MIKETLIFALLSLSNPSIQSLDSRLNSIPVELPKENPLINYFPKVALVSKGDEEELRKIRYIGKISYKI